MAHADWSNVEVGMEGVFCTEKAEVLFFGHVGSTKLFDGFGRVMKLYGSCRPSRKTRKWDSESEKLGENAAQRDRTNGPTNWWRNWSKNHTQLQLQPYWRLLLFQILLLETTSSSLRNLTVDGSSGYLCLTFCGRSLSTGPAVSLGLQPALWELLGASGETEI